jgi:hypothetical protein
MADKKISELADLSPVNETLQIPVNDSGTTKRISKSNLFKKTNILTVGTSGCDYTTVQSAVDAASTAGASGSNPFTILYDEEVSPVTTRDSATCLTTTGGVKTQGITLVLNSNEPKIEPTTNSPLVPYAWRADDGHEDWILEEAGTALMTGAVSTEWTVAGNVTRNDHAAQGVYPNTTAAYIRNTVDATYTGVFGYHALGSAVNLANYNYISFWIYSSALIGKDVITLGVSASATYASGIASVSMPGLIVQNRWHHVCLKLTDAMKALTINSIGLNATGMLQNNYVFINWVKATYTGGDACENYNGVLLGVNDFNPLYQLTPQGYAAVNGITISHAIIQNNVNTSNSMSAKELRYLTNRFGAEILCHSKTHQTLPPAYTDQLAETLGARDYLETLTDTTTIPQEGGAGVSFPNEIGMTVRGWIQPGTYTGTDTIDSKNDLYKSICQILKQYFKWSMAYYHKFTAQNKHFGATLCGTTQDATTIIPFLKQPTVQSIHEILATVTDGTQQITYIAFKALVDSLSLQVRNQQITSVNLTDFSRLLPIKTQLTKRYFTASAVGSTDLFTATNHGLQVGDALVAEQTIDVLTQTNTYYVVGTVAGGTYGVSTFQISTTSGGSALNVGDITSVIFSRPDYYPLIENGDIANTLAAPLGVTNSTRIASEGINASYCLKIGDGTNTTANLTYQIQETIPLEPVCFKISARGDGRTILQIRVQHYIWGEGGSNLLYELPLLTIIPPAQYNDYFIRFFPPKWADVNYFVLCRPATTSDNTSPIYIDNIQRVR